MEGQMDRLFYRTLPATAGGPITNLLIPQATLGQIIDNSLTNIYLFKVSKKNTRKMESIFTPNQIINWLCAYANLSMLITQGINTGI